MPALDTLCNVYLGKRNPDFNDQDEDTTNDNEFIWGDPVEVWASFEDNGSETQPVDTHGVVTTYYLQMLLRWNAAISTHWIPHMRVEIIGEAPSPFGLRFNPEGWWFVNDRRLPASGDRRRFMGLGLARENWPYSIQ